MLHFDEPTQHLNKEFSEYLYGKSVAIIGRAQYLVTVNQGDYINSFDVIIRVHHVLPRELVDTKHPKWDVSDSFVPQIYHKHLGSQTHIIYLFDWWAYTKTKTLPQYVNRFREAGGRFMCSESYSHSRDKRNKALRAVHPIRIISPDHGYNLTVALGSNPLGGTLAITDILKHNVKAAYLTGFLCFLDKSPLGLQIHAHASVNDFHYLRNLVNQHDNLTADSVMTNLFKKYNTNLI